MATAKKAAAKKAATKKASATRTPAKKTAAKKSAAKKSTSAARKTSSRGRMDATALLSKDHREVRALFKRYEKLSKADAGASERQALAQQICQMLTVHTQIEEEIFYPALRDAEVEEDLMDEAQIEHDSAKQLISQIQSGSPDDDMYDAKVTVLGEYVNHHVEEEEGEMFRKAQRAKVDMAELGQQLMQRKQALMGQGGGASESQGGSAGSGMSGGAMGGGNS